MARRRKRQSDEAPGWVWMLFGLGIGLIIAFGVYMNMQSAQITTAAVPPTAPPAAEPPEASPVIEEVPVQAGPEPEVAEESPPLAANDAEDPNRFSFYDELPSFEVVIPEVETPAARAQDVAEIADPGVYVVQAGSFVTKAEAETQRARLALLGIESRIQRVSIDDRTYHRVRIGPLEDLGELNSIHARLRGADIDSMIMRIQQ